MKRVVILTFATGACALLAGCNDASSSQKNYDPQLDGLSPPMVRNPDLTILEDQRKLYDKIASESPAPAPAPAPAPTSKPATTTP